MRFEGLACTGRQLVRSGTHETEAPPVPGGLRWGPSAILRPDDAALARFEEWTALVAPLVGPGHWPTGAHDTAHITVRSLGGRDPDATVSTVVDRYRAAAVDAAAAVGPVRFRVEALLLSPISVMVGLAPVDDCAERLARGLELALGPDGWFERDRVRDLWYANLVHFTGPIADPEGLVDWVDQFDEPAGFELTAEALEVVRWDHDGDRMRRTPLSHVPLA